MCTLWRESRGMSEIERDQRISSLELHPRVLSALKKAGLDKLSSVLRYSEGDLVRRTGLASGDVHRVVQVVSAAVLSSCHHHTALKLYQDESALPNWGRLSSGCRKINKFLHGGLLVPGITEIGGMSAAGKTQLCLQLCLQVQLPVERGGLNSGAVYVCTEDAFPNKRLHQLAEAFAENHGCLGYSARRLSDGIFVEHAATISSLSVQLEYKLPSLLSQHSVKLIVIDSLAALFRVEFTAGQAAQRAQLLRAFGAQLRKLSDEYGAAVVCVNQVTAAVDSGDGINGVRPSLGLAWADMVTMRLLLTREEGVENCGDSVQKNPAPVPRTMRVLLAPHLPPNSLTYCIDSSGVHGIDVDDMHARTVITEANKPINDQYPHQPRAFS